MKSPPPPPSLVLRTLAVVVVVLLGCCSQPSSAQPSSGCARLRSESKDMAGGPYALQGSACAVHDPSIAVEDGRLYLFSTDTGAQPGYAGNLLVRCGDATNTTFALCGQIFSSMSEIPWWRSYAPTATNIWAPDVTFFAGLWHVYFAISEFGKPNSVIGLVTRSTLSPSSNEVWSDQGPILTSNGTEGFNAIDPSIVLDAGGDTWMVWGSFWEGVFLGKVDAATGQMDSAVKPVNIANRADGTDALEGAFLVERRGLYFLFLSWGVCCRGAQSTYEVRVGRSSTISGPYVDKAGVSLLAGGGTHLLGGDNSGGPDFGWAAGGGQSLLRETVNASVTTWVVHGYDGASGDPWANVLGLEWGADGWPAAVPLG
jgi:arabinan endo-1,5-alpha-L-arabinosidase